MPSEPPDPRFTLANERTFLAWVRTALGLLAAAVGLVAVDVPWPDTAVRMTAALLAAGSGLTAVWGSVRWQRVQTAIDAGSPAPKERAHYMLAGLIVLIALAALVLTTTS
jgi:putative membrane protein